MIVPTYISLLIHIENPTRCHSVSKFYFIFIWSSTCFGRHTAHHQEPKTALAASGFAYMEGCWTCSCWTLPDSVQQLHVQQPSILQVCTSLDIQYFWYSVFLRNKHFFVYACNGLFVMSVWDWDSWVTICQMRSSQIVFTQLYICIYNSTDGYTSQYGECVLGWMTRQSGCSRG